MPDPSPNQYFVTQYLIDRCCPITEIRIENWAIIFNRINQIPIQFDTRPFREKAFRSSLRTTKKFNSVAFSKVNDGSGRKEREHEITPAGGCVNGGETEAEADMDGANKDSLE